MSFFSMCIFPLCDSFVFCYTKISIIFCKTIIILFKKMKNKIFPFFLAVVLFFSTLPVFAILVTENQDFSQKVYALIDKTSFGSSNASVSELQSLLASDPSIYPEGMVTGYYGNLTRSAVNRFSVKYPRASSSSLSSSAVEQVYFLINQTSFGSSNTSVSELQSLLASDPSIYPEGMVTGYYGNLTRSAVSRFSVKYPKIAFSPSPVSNSSPVVAPVPTTTPTIPATPTPTVATTVTTPTTTTTSSCNRTTGGTGCFGQTQDGRWFTLAEEKAGMVTAPNGTTSVALFHPSLAGFLNPPENPTPEQRPIAIYPRIPGGISYWGCGSDPNSVVINGANGKWSGCSLDLESSLRGNTEYVIRLPVLNGFVPSPQIMILRNLVKDDYRAWLVSVSEDPSIPIEDPLSPGQPSEGIDPGCFHSVNTRTFNAGVLYKVGRSGCSLLTSVKTPGTKKTLYVKVKAAPSGGLLKIEDAAGYDPSFPRDFPSRFGEFKREDCGVTARCAFHLWAW
jgi:peptidoglycan hydrolase-like protein with peptidoglycan-binding domain